MATLARLLIAAALVACVAGCAGAAEIRRITFPDGRSFVGEVIATTSNSLTLRLPSGDLIVPFSANPEILVATEAEVSAQPPLSIVVLETRAPADLAWRATELNDFLIERLAAIPHTRVTGADSLPPDTRSELTDCGQSIGCMLKALHGTGLHHAVVSLLEHHEDGEQLRLISLGIPEQVERSRAELVVFGDVDSFRNRILAQGYRILELQPLEPIADDAPVVLGTADGGRVGTDRQDDAADPDGAALIGQTTETNPEEGAEGNDGGTGSTVVDRGTGPETRVQVLSSDLKRRRNTAIALGFVPFPGLGSAHLRDPSGFVISMALDVGAGAGLVYLFGDLSPTALGFYLPAILTTYGVGVLVNQIAAAVSFRRYRNRFGADPKSAGTGRGPAFSALVVGLPGGDDGSAIVHLGLSLTGW